MIEKETDIIIVGSGPGGATVARELARSQAGLTVTLLERAVIGAKIRYTVHILV